jgi:SAM-dependent methyltransferase
LVRILDGVFDTRFGVEGSFEIAACRDCGLEQTRPLPSAGELKALYEAHYNFGGERDTAYTRLRRALFESPAYRMWMALDGDISFHGRRGAGRLLDVGCNEGRGLRLYRRNGFQAEGLELNEKAAEAARSEGFTVHTALLEDFRPETLYDAVVLSNVLEHVPSPSETLRHVNRLLKNGGQVWISLPNAKSWLRALFGRKWINWHVPFHLTHFTGERLRTLLSGAGFEDVRVLQETPALWAASSLIAWVAARPGRPTRALRRPLLVASLMLILRGFFFPVFWLFNRVGRGDCLVLSARKT